MKLSVSLILIICAIFILIGTGLVFNQLFLAGPDPVSASCQQKAEDFKTYAAENKACDTAADCSFIRISEATCDFHLIGKDVDMEKAGDLSATYKERCLPKEHPVAECMNPLENKVKICRNQRCELVYTD